MEDAIQHMSDCQHIRLRPELYFGDLNELKSANCLMREAYCLAMDQISGKACSCVISEFFCDGFLRVAHDGTPLGIEPDSWTQRCEMETIAEVLRACAERAASDLVRSATCKVGIVALNALCERFELHNFCNGRHYFLEYNYGERSTPVQCLEVSEGKGVAIRLKLDNKLIKNTEVDIEALKAWFHSIPIDCSAVDIVWRDLRNESAG
jgi:DNA gyrase/topoisomerase IV subunit B